MTPADLVRESDSLHARVVEFARARDAGRPAESFDALALDIARFQARAIPGVRRLVEAKGGASPRVDGVPAVPVDAFRIARIAAHAPELDAVRFETSGTTGGASGVHPMRVTNTYRELSLLGGRRALLGEGAARRVVVALAPPPGDRPTSSLGFMMREFMVAFDGRPIDEGERFDPDARERWLFGPGGANVEGLRRTADVARARGEPLLVLATAFALVGLCDALGERRLAAPDGTVVMPTGGTKGRAREVDAATLSRDVARAFGIAETQIVGEYGMTELTSQLYEGTLPSTRERAPRGVYVPPPWLSVVPVDPATLGPVPDGERGIARFVDLGNVDFPMAIVTEDLISRSGGGIVLHGRRPGARARGCSLAIEEMVLRGAGG